MSAGRPATRLWREALAQVDELLQRTETDREQALDEMARSRPHIHSIVASLLAAERVAQSEGFLEPRPLPEEQRLLRPDALLGSYRIIRQLGEGGMGEVWLARRHDGLYEGEVAIKTLHPYFAGGALRERFLREADLLGRLSHPHIARLLDAGVTPAGVVYLVLEYVRGVSIDAWCDDRRLDIASRLRLFIDVCTAVAHAHARLIVHRDIKPSNILVTETGDVKLLDFGVAKLMETESRAAAELTRLTGRVFTPEYAAPEQILGEPVTTATDVYSLGVLLYTLLTGCRPYTIDAAKASGIEHAVLHDEPIKPSRVVASLRGERIGALRSSTPARLRRRLAGDLDNIVARALCKAPNERYSSVLALADDLRRHLHDEPVLARPEAFVGRTRKFVRRHRVAVVSAAVVLFAVLAGVVAVVRQSGIAREQAVVARAQALKATAIKDFLIGLFEPNDINNPQGSAARQTTAAQLLQAGSERILSSLHEQPEVRVELLDTLGDLNLMIEDYAAAESLYRERVRFVEGRSGPGSVAMAEALLDLGMFLRERGRYADAQAEVQRAALILDAAGERTSRLRGHIEEELGKIVSMSADPGDPRPAQHYRKAIALLERHPESEPLVFALLGLARTLEWGGDMPAAKAMNERGIEVARRAMGERAIGVAGGYQQLARVLTAQGDLDAAEASLKRAIEIFEFRGGPGLGYTVVARDDMGLLLLRRGRIPEALELYGQVIGDYERAWGAEHLWTLKARLNLADGLRAVGALREADTEVRSVRATLARIEHGRWADALADRFQALIDGHLGRVQSARELAQRSVAAAREMSGENDPRIGEALLVQAQVELLSGGAAEAQAALRQARRLLPDADVGRMRQTLLARALGSQLALLDGRTAESGQMAQELLEQLDGLKLRADLWEIEALARLRLAEAKLATREYAAGCEHAQSAIALREPKVRPADPTLALMRIREAQCHEALGEHTKARQLREAAAKAYDEHPSLAPFYRAALARSRKT